MTTDISDRRALAIELLDLSRKIEGENEQIDAIKAKLKEIANQRGSFQEAVPDRGIVKVRAASDAKFRGILPVLDAELYLASDESIRTSLEQDGVVAMKPSYGRPGHASVTVELDPAKAG